MRLLEAGPDYANAEVTPTDLRDCWRMSLREHDWGFTAEAVPGRFIPYPRGRAVGGSSAVNAAIAAYVHATVTTQFHPCGTARMGPANDPMAVVDQHGRLRDIENLHVADASIMPTIPRANINLTCIMIAERLADWIGGEV